MLIPCKEIAQTIENNLRQEVSELKKKGKTPKLLAILVGESSEQLSFVSIKEKVAARIDAGFEFVHFQKVPDLHEFISFVEKRTSQDDITGVIIQQPLPLDCNTEDIYSVIPPKKEIEGFHPESIFHFPLSLSVLTGIKYIFNGKDLDNSIVNFEQDKEFFKKNLQDKKIVIAGRGPTGGKPIGEALTDIGISFINTHSQTENPEKLYKNADIIITATGRKIISPEMLKRGVVLLNVGLREEHGFLKGDYSEKEIENIASYYTKTPGGLGPIDVLYLYKNLIDATKTQLA